MIATAYAARTNSIAPNTRAADDAPAIPPKTIKTPNAA